MNLSPELEKRYTKDNLNAREAQRLAEFIAFGPVIFQTARIMLKWGIMDMLRDSEDGLTIKEVANSANISLYSAKCLIEASLCMGIILIDQETDRFKISKTGWFLINDPAVRVNIDFNHDVNYEGWFHLEEALRDGKPAGLKHFGNWPTVYEGLSSLPEQVQKSWFGFDHFYSDSSFPEALEIVFKKNQTTSLYDVGGNTGKWALQCVSFDKDVQVTILDLPQQIKLMEANVSGNAGSERIKGHGINLLDASAEFPKNESAPDAIWMSQFLDCFSMDEIVSILSRAKGAMKENSRIYIMETLWDRQRFEPAALCLTMTSLYFTAIANGNSKMYNTEDLAECIKKAGLEIEEIYDGLGQGHSILKVKLINQ